MSNSQNGDVETRVFRGSQGSIVRLKIFDFMTYHKVEFFAGSNVNLIMGPNGTGKSTIVCAICLVMAGKQNILGRAHQLKEFIRHGCKRASVEVELFNPNEAEANWVVKRVITETKTGAASDWYLNDRKTSQAIIEQLMKSLNIELDNLCQFLPQDRVQDFAKQDAIQLLRSTEKAIGNNNDVPLIQRHEDLLELQKLISQITNQVARNEEILKVEEQHNTRLEQQVRQVEDREKIEKEVKKLEGLKLWTTYVEALTQFREAKTEHKKTELEKKKVEKQLLPLRSSVDALKSKSTEKQNQLSKARTDGYRVLDSAQKLYNRKQEHCSDFVAKKNAELDEALRLARDKQRRLQELIDRTRGMEEELAEHREKEDRSDDEIKAEIRTLNQRKAAFDQSFFGLKGREDLQKTDRGHATSRYKMIESRLQNIEDLRETRINYLRRRNQHHILKAIEFFSIPENRAKFRGEIHEPMILHVNVSDLRFGKIAERFLSSGVLYSFMCEDYQDVKTFISLTKANNMRVSIIHHENNPQFRTPAGQFTEETRKRYDLNYTMADILVAPNYYMSYLCVRENSHLVPIGTERTDRVFQELVNNTRSLKQFYTTKYAYTVRTSQYTNEKNTTVSTLYDANLFTDKVNSQEKTTLEGQLADEKRRIDEIEIALKKSSSEILALRSQIADIESAKNELENFLKHKCQLIAKIHSNKEIIEKLQLPTDNEQLRNTVRQQTYNAHCEVFNCLEQQIDKIVQLNTLWTDLLYLKKEASILERAAQWKMLKLEEDEAKLTNFNERMEESFARARILAQRTKDAQEVAKQTTKQQEPPREVIQNEISADEIETRITTLGAQLSFFPDADPQVIQDYQNRKRKIVEMEREKKKLEIELEMARKRMEEIKGTWLQSLEDLLSRVNVNFGRFFASMRCVGEVSLDKGENENDFSRYGVKIRVKFRSDEPLVELSGWKQSGGERAISTALYILSLQELTKVPFRVIDEINQGMDAMNESRFFNLLCSIAEGEDTPQYFLLTPKMLPPVDYPDNVDFHVIFNGPFVRSAALEDQPAPVPSTPSQHRGKKRRSAMKQSEDESSEED